MNPMGYSLNFTIPQGPTGPTGPKDDFIKSFGNIYNQNQIDSTFLPNNQSIQIALPLKSLELNIFYPFDNTIGFRSEGAYLISYSILVQIPSASPTKEVTVTTQIRLNQSIIDVAPVTITIKNDMYYYFTNTTIINRQINDSIDLLIQANDTVDWNYTTAYLSAIKISNIVNS